MKSRKHAFTLIELLTVIAIIGILAAILIPVVAAARDRARAARCIGNLRSCGIGLLAFLEDNDFILHTFSGGGAAGPETIWSARLFHDGYIDAQRSEALYCPSWGDHLETAGNPWWFTYGINVYDPQGTTETITLPRGGGSYNAYTINLNTIDSPSNYLLLADSYDPHPARLAQIFRLHSNINNGGIHLRHSDRARAVFLDGHVESVGPERLSRVNPRPNKAFDERGNQIDIPDPPF